MTHRKTRAILGRVYKTLRAAKAGHEIEAFESLKVSAGWLAELGEHKTRLRANKALDAAISILASKTLGRLPPNFLAPAEGAATVDRAPRLGFVMGPSDQWSRDAAFIRQFVQAVDAPIHVFASSDPNSNLLSTLTATEKVQSVIDPKLRDRFIIQISRGKFQDAHAELTALILRSGVGRLIFLDQGRDLPTAITRGMLSTLARSEKVRSPTLIMYLDRFVKHGFGLAFPNLYYLLESAQFMPEGYLTSNSRATICADWPDYHRRKVYDPAEVTPLDNILVSECSCGRCISKIERIYVSAHLKASPGKTWLLHTAPNSDRSGPFRSIDPSDAAVLMQHNQVKFLIVTHPELQRNLISVAHGCGVVTLRTSPDGTLAAVADPGSERPRLTGPALVDRLTLSNPATWAPVTASQAVLGTRSTELPLTEMPPADILKDRFFDATYYQVYEIEDLTLWDEPITDFVVSTRTMPKALNPYLKPFSVSMCSLADYVLDLVTPLRSERWIRSEIDIRCLRRRLEASDILYRSEAEALTSSDKSLRLSYLFEADDYAPADYSAERSAMPPFLHYWLIGRFEDESPNALFDPGWYRGRYMLMDPEEDCFTHFSMRGGPKEYSPHPLINTRYIRSRHQNFPVGPELVFHIRWDTYGSIRPHQGFDQSWYFRNYLAEEPTPPLPHYLRSGANRGCWPNPQFDQNFYYKQYLQSTPEYNPLIEYMRAGMYFGHSAMSIYRKWEFYAEAELALSLGACAPAIDRFWQYLGFLNERSQVTTLDVLPVARLPAEMDQVQKANVREPRLLCAPGHNKFRNEQIDVQTCTSYRFDHIRCFGKTHAIESVNEHILLSDEIVGFSFGRHLVKRSPIRLIGDGKVMLQYTSPRERRLAHAIPLLQEYSENYFHAMLELLPRLSRADSLETPAGTVILLDAGLPSQAYSAVRALNRSGRHVIAVDPLEAVDVDVAHYVSPGSCIYDPRELSEGAEIARLSPNDIQNVRDGLLGSESLSVKLPALPPSRRLKLFLSRGGSLRRLLNVDEIMKYLDGEGFDIVETGSLELSEQIYLMQNADIVIAPTGAACTNIIFAQPSTKFYVLGSDAPGMDYQLWTQIGDAVGVDVTWVLGRHLPGTHPAGHSKLHSDFVVDLDVIRLLVEIELDNASRGEITPALFVSRLDQIIRYSDMRFASDHIVIRGTDVICDVVDELHSWLLATAVEYITSDRWDLQSELADLLLGFLERNGVSALERIGFRAGRGRQDMAPEDRQTLIDHVSDVSDLTSKNWRFRLAVACFLFSGHELPKLPLRALYDRASRAEADAYLSHLLLPTLPAFIDQPEAVLRSLVRLIGVFDEALEHQQGDLKFGLWVSDYLNRFDLAHIHLLDVDCRDLLLAREQLLCRLNVIFGEVGAFASSATDTEARFKIAFFVRTLRRGPDAESIVNALQRVDRSRYVLIALSASYEDEVVSDDRAFAERAAATFDQILTMSSNVADFVSQLRELRLDAFCRANATSLGFGKLDRYLSQRIAKVQFALNMVQPSKIGSKNYDVFVTPETVDVQTELETPVRMVGAPIRYDLRPELDHVGDMAREWFGLSSRDFVCYCSAASGKLSREFLLVVNAILGLSEHVKIVLAPFNPGWGGTHFALATFQALRECIADDRRQQVVVLNKMSVEQAHAVYDLADLFLASFPHGGVTSASIALAKGVPVVARRRTTYASLDEFLLESIGRPDLVAATSAEYVAIVKTQMQRSADERALQRAQIRMSARNADFYQGDRFAEVFAELLDRVSGQREAAPLMDVATDM